MAFDKETMELLEQVSVPVASSEEFLQCIKVYVA
jgi:hypothetical protein